MEIFDIIMATDHANGSPEHNIMFLVNHSDGIELNRAPGCVESIAKASATSREADAKTGVGIRCLNCGVAKIAPGTRLTSCSIDNCNARYCSKKCQRVDWKVCNHRDV